MDGLGVEQNYAKAKKYFENASLEDPNSLVNLGILCEKESNYTEAIKYYEDANNKYVI